MAVKTVVVLGKDNQAAGQTVQLEEAQSHLPLRQSQVQKVEWLRSAGCGDLAVGHCFASLLFLMDPGD